MMIAGTNTLSISTAVWVIILCQKLFKSEGTQEEIRLG
jgi:hypothetical protein